MKVKIFKITELSSCLATAGVNWAPVLVRLSIAIVMWPHGAQLLLGWFGGYGFKGTMVFLQEESGLPWIAAFLVIMIQFFGSLFILVGLFTRLCAYAMFIIVIGMIFNGHTEHGFFMNWFGSQKGEGYEFHLLLLGLCISLILTGGGKISLDSIIRKKNKK
ncbi:MAG: hypothetical protein K0S32_1914 [Bacteroidetes bacterium]|jgi:putative oxidoreductase|nr:hypothetical protein [Bacteroidota bacterium]